MAYIVLSCETHYFVALPLSITKGLHPLLHVSVHGQETLHCRKLRLNNKKVQQAVVDVDGGLELLQASGFELVFDESSPEPQAAAAPSPTMSTPQQGATDRRLAHSESQSSAGLPFEEASSKGTASAEPPQQEAASAEVGSAQLHSSLIAERAGHSVRAITH